MKLDILPSMVYKHYHKTARHNDRTEVLHCVMQVSMKDIFSWTVSFTVMTADFISLDSSLMLVAMLLSMSLLTEYIA